MGLITNSLGLSEGLFQALKHDEYDRGECDFSATELITPSRIVALRRAHEKELVEDASDLIYRVLGRAAHSIAENAKRGLANQNPEARVEKILGVLREFNSGHVDVLDLPKALTNAVEEADSGTVKLLYDFIFEERFYRKVTLPDGREYTVSGQIDDYNIKEKIIRDYKLTSRWVSLNGEKDEWTKQMNIYAWLLRGNNYDPEKAIIEAMYRDWSKGQAARDPGYPQKQVEPFSIELWEPNVAEEYVLDRVMSHANAIGKNEEDIPVCSEEERWSKSTTYAVTKPNRARALRVLDSRDEALSWIGQHKKPNETMSIEERPGESTRCINYCPVSDFCSFRKYFV